MFAVFLQGVLLGAAMILPLGPQNAFVMNQGIRRQYHLMVALLCAVSDMVLISAGIFGGSALLSQSSLLLGAVTWGGVAFLLWFGWGAMRTAFSKNITLASADVMKQSRWRIIATMLAVTWLNPHVYLDTFVVLGSLGSQFTDNDRSWFALGTITASFTWFFALALLAAWLAPWLNTPRVQRAINFFVGVVMWGIALQLARHGWQ
ncbi:arginine exporter protein [Pectobacterium betavasculorum]|uniref:Arginine exporter protein ArgO n=1 Tax=Pectobacterium betavasculorum TaxID=55207 RepID=A0A093S4Z0_9GAMM|nr:arginine exporter ArgO [Pectobacterium betavasculorum]KFX05176.1 arginine exporter protein [Pectobacterium betavasculorum]KFX19462.1 arginine exporter protein [Pectobacterium betavasculorum]